MPGASRESRATEQSRVEKAMTETARQNLNATVGVPYRDGNKDHIVLMSSIS